MHNGEQVGLIFDLKDAGGDANPYTMRTLMTFDLPPLRHPRYSERLLMARTGQQVIIVFINTMMVFTYMSFADYVSTRTTVRHSR